MKQVYIVRYKRNDTGSDGTYYIVANSTDEAEDIAFSCIANNPPAGSIGPERPSSYGRGIAKIWVKDTSVPTETDKVGLIGSGSEILLAEALALYVKKHNKLY